MTRILISLIALISLSSMLTSCKKLIGEGPVVTEYRNYNNFSGIDLSIDATVNIMQDSIYSIQLMAQQNILDNIKMHINGNILCIGFKPNIYMKTNKGIIINIHMPSISSIDVSGSGDVYATSEIVTTNLDLNISGSGKINLNSIEAQSIEQNISGSGKIILGSGSANTLDTKISGSGDIEAMNLQAKSIQTSTSGSGTTKVHATESLDVKISGSGDVYYKGNPSINADISGSGKLIHQN